MASKKSSKSAIARRYARALFEFATEKNSIEKIESDINEIDALISSSPEFLTILKNPVLGRNEISAIFTKVTEKTDIDKITKNFALLLGENRRLGILPEIMEQFRNILAESRGELKAQVTSATALDDSQRNNITKQLKEFTGKDVSFTEAVDEEIIGGLKIKIGSQLLDNSISGKLERLAVLQKQAALPQ